MNPSTVPQEAISKNSLQAAQERPFHVGVFDSMAVADDVVAALLVAGFTKDEITVVCSQEAVRRHFKEFEHQDPAGTNAPAAMAAGGAIGAALGGLAVVAGAATGGVALLAAGGLALWTGGILGGLVGAMMTRGVEKELANFYNQALTRGKILVAAEQHSGHAEVALTRADQIFAEHGAHPLPLPEG